MLTDADPEVRSSGSVVRASESTAVGGQPGALTIPLFVVVCAILLCLTVLLGASLYFQHLNYSLGVNSAIKGAKTDHNSIITYSRAWDFAVIKTSSLFLAFTLIFVGSLYVLRIADSNYSLKIEGKEVKGSLETSSPGLVMITLGVILVGLVLYDKSLIDYRPSPQAVAVSPEGDGLVQPQSGEPKPPPKAAVGKEQQK